MQDGKSQSDTFVFYNSADKTYLEVLGMYMYTVYTVDLSRFIIA